jgi:hypothetical protein
MQYFFWPNVSQGVFVISLQYFHSCDTKSERGIGMKSFLTRRLSRLFGISILWMMSSMAARAEAVRLTVTDGTFTIPAESAAVLTMRSTASYDVICNVKVIGVIKGHDPATGAELTARQSSDSVLGFVLKANRGHERRFDFVKAVQNMRRIWRDPQAVLVEVDPMSVTADCERYTGSQPGTTCTWRGATVQVGKWLECPDCAYRYCQCQSNGGWGNCRNDQPSEGACDWSNPDWGDPACSQGGSKPCDWSNPDWSNPSCQQ